MAAEGAFFSTDRGEPVPGYVVFGREPERFTTGTADLEGVSGVFIPDPRDETATLAPFMGMVRNAGPDAVRDASPRAPAPWSARISYEILRP